MKISLYLFHLALLLSVISPSLPLPNIVKALPGYPGDIPFKLETGYIGVGEGEEVQLFYYFTESERDVESDPLLLWLTGGPGCSALSGLVFEIGPLVFNLTASSSESDTPKLQQNPYSWTKVASIIFVDSPVGTGFSYATTSEAYYSNDTLQSTHIYDFLRKWFITHPRFTKNPLYISGDSYSGLIVPNVVQEILQGNEIGLRPKLNLKGYVLGNPLTKRDDTLINAKYEYAHRISLVSDELYTSAVINCNGTFENTDAKSNKCVNSFQAMKQEINSIHEDHVLEHKCLFVSPKQIKKLSQLKYQVKDRLIGFPSGLHIEEEFCRNEHYLLAYSWADDKQVREALHIKEGSIGRWIRCNKSLAYEMNVLSSFHYHQNFSGKPLRVLVYSGDQDLTIPYVDTFQWIKELNIPTSEDWRPWFVDGQVAGYVTEYSRLPYQLVLTTIKGGGHTAPEYKPRQCLAMLDRWFSLAPL